MTEEGLGKTENIRSRRGAFLHREAPRRPIDAPFPYTKQKARTRGCAPFFRLLNTFTSETAQYLLTSTEVMTTFAAGTSKVASYEPPETNSSRMVTSCSSVKESSSLSDW